MELETATWSLLVATASDNYSVNRKHWRNSDDELFLHICVILLVYPLVEAVIFNTDHMLNLCERRHYWFQKGKYLPTFRMTFPDFRKAITHHSVNAQTSWHSCGIQSQTGSIAWKKSIGCYHLFSYYISVQALN